MPIRGLSTSRRFREVADSVGAILLVDMAHFSGLVAAGIYPNPCDHADIVTSTTHKTLRGPRVGPDSGKREIRHSDRQIVFPGAQGGPLVHVIAAKAICFLEAMQPEFVEYSEASGRERADARSGSDRQRASASFPAARTLILLLVDVFAKGVRGKEAEIALDKANITVNKNGIPFDVNPPLNPSGIRLGSPAVTTRGFGGPEMAEVASCIAQVLREPR